MKKLQAFLVLAPLLACSAPTEPPTGRNCQVILIQKQSAPADPRLSGELISLTPEWAALEHSNGQVTWWRRKAIAAINFQSDGR